MLTAKSKPLNACSSGVNSDSDVIIKELTHMQITCLTTGKQGLLFYIKLAFRYTLSNKNHAA
jgi:hypothetical protein